MKTLILCTGNSCRSQTAQGFMKFYYPKWEVLSAGTKPAERVNPFAIVMAEKVQDIGRNCCCRGAKLGFLYSAVGEAGKNGRGNEC